MGCRSCAWRPWPASSSPPSTADTPPLEDWLGDVAEGIRRVCSGPLKVLGYDTQRIHANWKAYHENPRDSYHANILHTFYGTFGLSRRSQESGMVLDPRGRNVRWHRPGRRLKSHRRCCPRCRRRRATRRSRHGSCRWG